MTQTIRKNLLPFIGVLSFIGAALSVWQTRLFYITRSGMSEMHTFCNIGQTFDCTAIEMSRYSELFPGFPLSAFAIAGYLMIFIISLYGMSETMRKNSRSILVALTSVAFLFSIVYLVIMTTQIGKLCLLCLTVDVINLIMLLIALKLPKPDHSKKGGTIGLPRFVGSGFLVLFIGFLFTKGLNPQADMKQEDANDMVESVLTTPPVEMTIPTDAPVVGNPNAPITLVKFSDYQCPACKMGANAIHPLFKRYPDQVKFVFINYPLDMNCNPAIKSKMHEFACEAASVAICATEQGKFLDAYETLFSNQEHLATGKIADLLSAIPGIDLPKLKNCMTLPSTADKIKRDVEFGTAMKIQSTPTFFMNGKKVEGGLPTSLWIQIIDRTLKK
jgi:protein-disulfide isomerase/uncharacterized membrane protein